MEIHKEIDDPNGVNMSRQTIISIHDEDLDIIIPK
jgi:hypothetical protein